MVDYAPLGGPMQRGGSEGPKSSSVAPSASCQRESDTQQSQEVAGALAAVMTRLVSTDDREQPGQQGPLDCTSRGNPLSCFHVAHAPKASIHDYLMRLATHFRCSRECFVLSFVYIDRIAKRNPSLRVSSLSVHKLLLTSVVIAVKFLDDMYASNRDYARIGGIKTKELNSLEAQFLGLVGWRLHVAPTELEQYLGHLSIPATATAPVRTSAPAPPSHPPPPPVLPPPCAAHSPIPGDGAVEVCLVVEPCGAADKAEDEQLVAAKREGWRQRLVGLLRDVKFADFARSQDVFTAVCLLGLPRAFWKLGTAEMVLGGRDLPYYVDCV